MQKAIKIFKMHYLISFDECNWLASATTQGRLNSRLKISFCKRNKNTAPQASAQPKMDINKGHNILEKFDANEEDKWNLL